MDVSKKQKCTEYCFHVACVGTLKDLGMACNSGEILIRNKSVLDKNFIVTLHMPICCILKNLVHIYVLLNETEKDKHYIGNIIHKILLFLKASLGYQDSRYPFSGSSYDYNDNNRYDPYDNNRYDPYDNSRYDPYDNSRYNNMNYNWRSRGGMYDNDRMSSGSSLYNNYNDHNSRYNGHYNGPYNNRFNSRYYRRSNRLYNNYNNYNDYNDYNRRYDSHSGGYPVFGSQTSVF